MKYVQEIVLVLARASNEEFQKARAFMDPIPYPISIIHNDGKSHSEIYDTVKRNGLDPGPDGKGRSAWLAYGYVIATGKSHAIALHDCDIVTYSREMLARLCYPVVNQNLDYVFCKGYYSRVTNKLHGRVTRLMVTPLVRSLQDLVGRHLFLTFLDSFRYPLAGEFCMTMDMARVNRIPSDWGLEVGSLAEVYRNYSPRRVCQVDIAENYEHKHQLLSAENPEKGLMKMTIDICKSLFRTLAAGGHCFLRRVFQISARNVPKAGGGDDHEVRGGRGDQRSRVRPARRSKGGRFLAQALSSAARFFLKTPSVHR